MMKKTARALAGILGGLVIATVTVVGLPGVARADDSRPTVSGDCGATVADAEGDHLTVDAGAPLGRDGLLALGLGSAATDTGGSGRTPVSLPVADTLELLGADKAPVVSGAVTGGCDTVQRTVNTVSDTIRGSLGVRTAAEIPVLPKPAPSGEDPADPGSSPGIEAGDGAVSGSPDGSTDGKDVILVTVARPAAAPAASEEPSFLQVQRLPATPAAPDLNPDRDGRRPGDGDAGRIDALPASDQGNSRVPFILAVGLLVVVGTVVARRLIPRPSR